MAEPAKKLLGQLQLGTGTADIYNPTAPAPFSAQIKAIWICNTDTVARNVTIRFGTGSLTSANSLFDANPVPANDTWVIKDAEYLISVSAGQKLQGFADAGGVVTVSVFGEESP
jgi:hypothetical protein